MAYDKHKEDSFNNRRLLDADCWISAHGFTNNGVGNGQEALQLLTSGKRKESMRQGCFMYLLLPDL